MKLKEVMPFMEKAIDKFGDSAPHKERIDEMKETLSRLKLLSPERLNRELSKEEERKLLRYNKKLGIEK